MSGRLTLIFLFLGVFFCSSYLFVEKAYTNDAGYSDEELREIRNMSDKELREMKNYWSRKERKTQRKMVDPHQAQLKAEGELNRAKKGKYSLKDLVNPTDQESRIRRAQYKYDKAKEDWEKARDEHSDAFYKEGVADIYLRERGKSRRNR